MGEARRKEVDRHNRAARRRLWREQAWVKLKRAPVAFAIAATFFCWAPVFLFLNFLEDGRAPWEK